MLVRNNYHSCNNGEVSGVGATNYGEIAIKRVTLAKMEETVCVQNWFGITNNGTEYWPALLNSKAKMMMAAFFIIYKWLDDEKDEF